MQSLDGYEPLHTFLAAGPLSSILHVSEILWNGIYSLILKINLIEPWMIIFHLIACNQYCQCLIIKVNEEEYPNLKLNWFSSSVSHTVYDVEYIFAARLDGLTSLFNQLINEAMSIEDVKSVKWKMIEDPHISMSRTVTLRYHEIPHFTAHLKAEIVKTSNAKWVNYLDLRSVNFNIR